MAVFDDMIANRRHGATESSPAGAGDRLGLLVDELYPEVVKLLSGHDLATLSRQSLALKIGEISTNLLDASQTQLNLIDRRGLISGLIERVSAAVASGAISPSATPASPAAPTAGASSAAPRVPAPQGPATTPAASPTHRGTAKGHEPLNPATKAALEDAKRRIQPVVVQRIDIGAAAKLDREELRGQIAELVGDILREQKLNLNQREQTGVVELLLDDMLGLGPLEPLLADESINDIMVNGPAQVYIERAGKLVLTDVKFRDNAHVMNIASRIVSQVGRRVDESSPLCDARLLDGSRVNIIIPPLAIDGPSISIRKFSKKGITLDIMARARNISEPLATVLKIAARCRLNIVISGGTGSGKTTLLNAISQLIDQGERIVTIEDAAELQLQQPHVVRLETRPPNLEGHGEVSMRDLVKNALRMRPDRIILGEVRGAEAVDMLQAMNTGHDGSLGTVHANRPREALTRLENMVGMAGINLPAKAVRTQIASSLDLIVQIARMRDGMRRITHVTEVIGMEGDVITTQDLFTFEFEGEDSEGKLRGSFKSSGLRPHFTPKAAYFGLDRALLEAI
jgi:pilus assembly protein CpaF